MKGAEAGNTLSFDDNGNHTEMVAVITISPDGGFDATMMYGPDVSLSLLQSKLEGYIELFYRGPNFEFYCNEEGRLNNMEANRLNGMEANRLADMVTIGIEGKNWNLVGPVVVIIDELTASRLKSIEVKEPKVENRQDPLRKDDWQRAWDSQNACNIVALSSTLADITKRLIRAGLSSREINNHPVVRLYVTQIAHLSFGAVMPMGAYEDAYNRCLEMIDGKNERRAN